jgi:hypothetical protein
MSLAISLWVLIEEVGDNSPVPATTEEVAWRPTNKLDMRNIREARNRAIEEMEQQRAEQWETIMFNSSMII